MCFNQVLFIGPDIESPLNATFHSVSGEVGAVLGLYQQHMTPFKFMASSKAGNPALLNLLVFINCWVGLAMRLRADRDIKIVHIHGHGCDWIVRHYLLYVLASRIFYKKVVFHVHAGNFAEQFGARSRFFRSWVTRMVNQVDMVICPTAGDLAFLKNHFKPQMVFIVKEVVAVMEAETNPFIDGDLVKFVWIGKIADLRLMERCDLQGHINGENIKEGADLWELLELMEKNRTFYSGRIALLIGGVEMASVKVRKRIAGLQRLIRQKHLESFVSFVDCASADLKARLLSTSNVCILPGGSARSGFSVLEAMNYGKPVIAPLGAMTAEVVLNGINGFLRMPGDPAELARSMNHFLQHPDDLINMGAQSRDLIKSYDIHEALSTLRFLYSTLLN